MSAVLELKIFTGRPVTADARQLAAAVAVERLIFPPKPPPVRGHFTET